MKKNDLAAALRGKYKVRRWRKRLAKLIAAGKLTTTTKQG